MNKKNPTLGNDNCELISDVNCFSVTFFCFFVHFKAFRVEWIWRMPVIEINFRCSRKKNATRQNKIIVEERNWFEHYLVEQQFDGCAWSLSNEKHTFGKLCGLSIDQRVKSFSMAIFQRTISIAKNRNWINRHALLDDFCVSINSLFVSCEHVTFCFRYAQCGT